MKRSTIVLSAVVVLLVASNAWFAFGAIDCGISKTYLSMSAQDSGIALKQLLAVVPVVAASPSDRAAVLAAAKRSADHPELFEKEGFIWVGRIGLRFGPDDRVAEVVTAPK